MIFLLITGAILILLYFQLRKLNKLASKPKKEVKKYGKNVIAGIVAGVIVVVIDKGITLAFKSHPPIDYTSFWTIITTGALGFIMLLFEVGLILLLVIWIINKGLLGIEGKKK